jgi:ankyrin repeat protein
MGANQRAATGDTLLHLAAEVGDVDDIEALVDAGANVNAKGHIGNTPRCGTEGQDPCCGEAARTRAQTTKLATSSEKRPSTWPKMATVGRLSRY